jgi:hypothetical protein
MVASALLLASIGCGPPPMRIGHSLNGNAVAGGGGGIGGANLSSMGLPPDIHVGTQLAFWSGTATIAGKGLDWQPDENGNLVDPTTGERWSATDKEGNASVGWQEYTVVGVDDKQAILSQTTYGLRQGNSKTFFHTLVVGPLASAQGIWVNPQGLQAIQDSNDPAHRILRGQWPVGNNKVDCVIMKNDAPGSHTAYVYDTHTGLMVNASLASTGPASAVHEQGEVNTGNTNLMQLHMEGVRTMNVPWAGMPEPACAEGFHSMTFEGTNASGGSGRIFTSSLSIKYTLGARGAGWVACDVARTQGGIVANVTPTTLQSKMATGNCMPNPLWINPDALAKLQQGQTIDDDPVTKEVAKVGQQINGPLGTAICIVIEDPVEIAQYAYDLKTGMLVGIHTLDRELSLEDNVQLKDHS